MPWWKSKQPARPVITDPTLRSFRLSLAGWNEQTVTNCEEEVRVWNDAEENSISVGALKANKITSGAAIPGWSLQDWARDFARDMSGALIEADHVNLPFGPGLRVICQCRPVYHGLLIFPRNDVDIVITIVSQERGITGKREAILIYELLEQARLKGIDLMETIHSPTGNPYDPILDSRFPDHPLSKVRRLLAELPICISFDS